MELARRIGVPYTLIPATDARDIISRMKAHKHRRPGFHGV